LDLILHIEDLIEKNGSDFELSKLFKTYIEEYKLSLKEIFKSCSGKDFLVKHTKALDAIISLMYKTVLRQVFTNYLPMRGSIPIAIVALGSYGREQLCVHSDIDLLIVYEEVEGYNTSLIIEKLFYLALDAGLKLGHRVHSTKDLFRASKEDITIRTSLMESRFITGSSFTWQATQKELTKIKFYKPKEFILAKIGEAEIRRAKYPPSMQPNIKQSAGGLRDSQLLFWIASSIYSITTLKDLSDKLFSDEEYKEYRMALELLFRIRSALHLVAKKQEDRLALELMPQVAKILGFKDEQNMLIKVLHAQWRINNFTQIFVKKMIRPYIVDLKNIKKLKDSRLTSCIYLLDNKLYASYKLQNQNINKLLKLIISLKDRFYYFDASFLRVITYAKIPYSLSKESYFLIKELLKKEHSYCFLNLFYDAGILHKLFSSFKKVLHLPQFDGYHHYPVDIHSLKAVESLENIKEPFIKKLFDDLDANDKLILKLVVLLHDTGKGRKQDHSEVGAKLISAFASKLKLDTSSIQRASKLVKHHILMSNVAFKENIHNEKILYKFMSNIKDAKNLTLLYILTYADINGVGDSTYNSFNSKLLYDLYLMTLDVSQNSQRITDATKRLIIEKRVKNLEEFKILPKLLQTKLLRVESNLFFFMHNPKEIIEIAKKAQETKEHNYFISTQTSLSIEIYRKVPINLGFALASLSHLDVASMEIVTLFDGVKYFKIDFIKNVDGDELLDVKNILSKAFDMSRHIKMKEIDIARDEISIDCEYSLTFAELCINTKNQRGLLAYIMECFETLGINIATAKIHSTKYKVRDNFLMEKQNDICHNVAKIYELLCKD